MDRIIDNLKDPSWWFTAVLIAIVASLLAAYIKELAGIFLSHVSSRFRRRWRKRKIRSIRKAIWIARDSTTVILFVTRLITYILAFLLSTTLLVITAIGMVLDMPRMSLSMLLIVCLISMVTFGFSMSKEVIFFNRVAAASSYERKKRERDINILAPNNSFNPTSR
jgi:hypothetical protein